MNREELLDRAKRAANAAWGIVVGLAVLFVGLPALGLAYAWLLSLLGL